MARLEPALSDWWPWPLNASDDCATATAHLTAVMLIECILTRASACAKADKSMHTTTPPPLSLLGG